MKRPERSRRTRPTRMVESLETRSMMTIAATAPLPALDLAAGTSTQVDLTTHFKDSSPSATPSFAIVDTSLGTIPVQLTPQTTPKTVANFLSYAAKGSYDNTIVHRSVPGFIWQAGGFQLTSQPKIAAIAADAPVQNEFGASNTRGTIAMAKLGGDPNSATSQFFFNESDSNAANLDNQNGGFTVFGHVVGDDGLAVMDRVAAVPVPSPGPLTSPLDQIPLQNYAAGATVQPSNLVLIKDVAAANELFLASSDAPAVASASVQGGTLTVNPISTGTAHVMVIAYGSDGTPVAEHFAVNVSAAPTSTGSTTTPPAGNDPGGTMTTTQAPTTPSTPSTPQVPQTPTAVPVVAYPSTPAAAVVPRSDLTPSARGPVSASAVVGGRVKIQQTVTLKAASGPVSQREQVAVKLSSSPTGTPADYAIGAASKLVKLKAGKQASLAVSARRIDPSVPAGTYHVVVSVTDPDGASTTIDTGKMLTVRPR